MLYIYIYIYMTLQRVKRLQVQSYASIALSTYSASFVGWHRGIGCQPPALLICLQPTHSKSSNALSVGSGYPHTHKHQKNNIFCKLLPSSPPSPKHSRRESSQRHRTVQDHRETHLRWLPWLYQKLIRVNSS